MRVDRIRVLHITNHLTDAGGAEVSLIQMLPHLQACQIDNAVQPLSSFRPTMHREDLQESGVVLFDGRDVRLPGRLNTVARAIKAFRPDMVHSTVWDSDLAARLVAKPMGVPTIAGIVNAQYASEAYARAPHPHRLRAYQALDGLLARHATTAFHALTRYAAEEAVRSLGIPRDSVHVIPRGRDRTALGQPSPNRRSRVRAGLGIPEEAFVVVNVARQQPQKAIPDLIKAFRVVAREVPNAVLVQAGREAADTPEVRRLVEGFRLEDRVHLLGRRPDVPDLLAASDLFVSSAHWEGQGGAVLEAMGMGIAVVAYAVPAVAESLGGLGTLVPIGNTHELASAVMKLSRDPSARLGQGRLLRNRFDATYEVRRVAAQMASMYRSVAGGVPR